MYFKIVVYGRGDLEVKLLSYFVKLIATIYWALRLFQTHFISKMSSCNAHSNSVRVRNSVILTQHMATLSLRTKLSLPTFSNRTRTWIWGHLTPDLHATLLACTPVPLFLALVVFLSAFPSTHLFSPFLISFFPLFIVNYITDRCCQNNLSSTKGYKVKTESSFHPCCLITFTVLSPASVARDNVHAPASGTFQDGTHTVLPCC